MLGVVLWSDIADRKAVIWCEDQGDLAYVNAADSVLDNGEFFDAGDVIQFDVENCQKMRVANNPRLVIEKAGKALPDALKSNKILKPSKTDGAEIIAFEPFRSRQRCTVP
ncbi:MAG: hypothetical protein WBV62_07935 [Roseobacter sp.]